MKRRSSYKVTFFDRHGPEGGLRLKAFALGLMVSAVTFIAVMYISSQGSSAFFQPFPITVTLLAALTLGFLAMKGTLSIIDGAGKAAQYFTAGGSSTPYQDQFSEEQALVMQREYAQACALFEHRIATKPGDPRVLMAAADLYATHGDNPKRAAELYRVVQRLPEVASGQDVYVSNKLADLYLGPLKEPGRALVEFRRLIETYPGSVAADHARLALANLKNAPAKDVWDHPGTPGPSTDQR